MFCPSYARSCRMEAFMRQNFLLSTATARALYVEHAADLPIIDYHAHLPPADILSRKKFSSMAELWLGGDHYKWRLMRAAGISEELITGKAPDRDKFNAFCRILPLAAGNPVHQFCHLELFRIFGIDVAINEKTAAGIWEEGNAKLAVMDTWSLMEQAKVEVACTTDDPADDLAVHKAIAGTGLKTKVLPAYRPDKAMRINNDAFPAYLERLGQAAGMPVATFAAMVEALVKRVAFFHKRGARVSDHAVDAPLPAKAPTGNEAEALFAKRLSGGKLSEAELGQYHLAMLIELGKAYATHNWVMCLHLGAQRDNNTRMYTKLGPDTGYDSISDMTCSRGVACLLDSLEQGGNLPKTMFFPANSTMNDVLITLMACFQGEGVPGKLQFGPAWWFCDHKDGNLQQIHAFANNGLLGAFVGMLTDSRSFASYPRHDYFRRLLCRQLGEWVEAGEYPDDKDSLAAIVRGVSYDNAKQYFGM